MDTNRDGVVSRAEWRGNDQSFRQHDSNRDGVLSGDEVRAAVADLATTTASGLSATSDWSTSMATAT